MTAKDRAKREAAIRGAMAQLIHDQRFQEFINVVREQREAVIDDLCNERVMASERLTLGAIGELRAFKSIIAAYDEFVGHVEQSQAESAPD